MTRDFVDTQPTVGENPSIAVDSNDAAHICYYDWSPSVLKYATNKTGTWETHWINDRNSVAGGIAIDTSGFAHVCFIDAVNNGLYYATNKSGAWVVSVVDPASCGNSSIAIDSTGKVHFSYTSGTDLKYAKEN